MRLSVMRLRTARPEPMKKFRPSWSILSKTLRIARGVMRSLLLKLRLRSKRSRRRCRWTMLPGTSNVAGIGSKPKANSWPRRVKRAAKARKRRRSEILSVELPTWGLR